MHHHYVPQFLLSAWAAGDARGELEEFRLNLPGVPSRRRSPKATGFAEDLLALREPGLSNEERQSVELKVMQEIDSAASLVRLEMLRRGVSELTESQRNDWGKFLNSLRLRQPQFVEQKIRTESAEELVRQLERNPEDYQELAQPGDPRTLFEWVQKNEPSELHDFGAKIIPAVLGHEETLDQLRSLTWAVLDLSKARHELLLADNPLISAGTPASPIWRLALPLSPSHVFFACRTGETIKRIKAADLGPIVGLINETSVQRANRWVYGRNNAARRFIQNRVSKLRLR